ncbi:OmpA family protein [Haematobacter genomosp. 1]|uniref:OmpA-like domain-containing protein n=1 Tax=Haematobacter genomosp. 1 TaxID=366618 RepID=A0A212AAA8_9RHOB|nr:OmpA family protein [Haematobacter genomosp. 1]OWJ77049.1 hypothetical protein CDV49_12955 [Haematobacter genomosp. 1]
MRLSPALLSTLALAAAAGLSLIGASFAARAVEDRAVRAVDGALDTANVTWARASADGLTVTLAGTAPTEAARFRALTVAGGVVDPSRVIDTLEVAAAAVIPAPTLSVEILRNRDGISVIGLIPVATGREAILDPLIRVANGVRVSDMVEATQQPVPKGWAEAVGFGVKAAELLPRSKISIAAGRVAVTAVADSPEQKQRLERELRAQMPASVPVTLDISAPRPVITPFTLRFVMDGQTPHFDACAAPDEAALGQIIAAALAAGMEEPIDCQVGLGAPSQDWGQAAAQSIAALAALGGGTLTLADADITLEAAEGTDAQRFEEVVSNLDASLPSLFSLHANRPVAPVQEAATAESGPPEFTATLDAEGGVTLRGRFLDERQRAAVESYARARFGAGAVNVTTRLDDRLPQGWALRVLAGLEALGELNRGELLVTQDRIAVRGVTGDKSARGNITRTLSSRLGRAAYTVDVSYDERLDPQAALPTPQECVRTINAILDSHKITFAPGSATINADARQTLDKVAEAMIPCIDVKMEIGGHTDSQGRNEMNLQLSQARAEAVLEALLARRVPISNLTARGYGETRPIADNGKEEGREANRRIAFTLIIGSPDQPALPEPVPAPTARPEAVTDAARAAEAEAPPAEETAGSMDDDASEEGEPMDAIDGDEEPPPATEAPDTN